jgi:hypothetical protein
MIAPVSGTFGVFVSPEEPELDGLDGGGWLELGALDPVLGGRISPAACSFPRTAVEHPANATTATVNTPALRNQDIMD